MWFWPPGEHGKNVKVHEVQHLIHCMKPLLEGNTSWTTRSIWPPFTESNDCYMWCPKWHGATELCQSIHQVVWEEKTHLCQDNPVQAICDSNFKEAIHFKEMNLLLLGACMFFHSQVDHIWERMQIQHLLLPVSITDLPLKRTAKTWRCTLFLSVFCHPKHAISEKVYEGDLVIRAKEENNVDWCTSVTVIIYM